MKFVEENYENMLADLKTLVSYNSVYSDDVKPFGSVNREVLDKALEVMVKLVKVKKLLVSWLTWILCQ